jgi:hypothetical protein
MPQHIQIVGKRVSDNWRSAIVVNGEFVDVGVHAAPDVVLARICNAMRDVQNGESYDLRLDITPTKEA